MEQLPAPQATDPSIKGAVHKNGHVDFREDNGKFMNKAQVAELSADIHADFLAKQGASATVETDYANIDPATADFSWDEVQNELASLKDTNPDLDKASDIKPFLLNLAGQIKTHTESGKPIQGTGEYEPDVTTFSFTRKDADGKETTEEVPSTIAFGLKALESRHKTDQIAAAVDAATAPEATASKDTPLPPPAPKTPETTAAASLVAPEAGSIAAYVDAEGKPMTSADALRDELAKKAAAGDDTNLDELTWNLLERGLAEGVDEDVIHNFIDAQRDILDSNKAGEPTPEFAAPNAEDRIARSGAKFDAAGNLVGTPSLLSDLRREFAARTGTGDDSDLEELSRRRLEAETVAAHGDPVLIADAQRSIERDKASIMRTKRERENNPTGTEDEQRKNIVSRAWARVRNGRNAAVVAAGNVAAHTTEKSDRKRNWAIAGGALAVAAVGIYVATRLGHDTPIDAEVVRGYKGTPPKAPSIEALNAAAGGGASAAARTAAEVLPTPPASTFTVLEKWHQGSPTEWSWARSLGIPEQNVPDFLRTIDGPEWAANAQNAQIGHSVSATAEQIAQFATAA